VKLLREEADRDAGYYSFERGTNDDSTKLISDGRCEPCSQAVDGAQDSAEDYSDQGLGHRFSPSIQTVLFFY
jgi:hypothetical protein